MMNEITYSAKPASTPARLAIVLSLLALLLSACDAPVTTSDEPTAKPTRLTGEPRWGHAPRI